MVTLDSVLEAIIDNVGNFALALVTFVAVWFGLRQWKEGQKHQKAHVLLKLIDSFRRDEHIQAACAMLDWDEREIRIGREKFHFTNAKLIKAFTTPPMDHERDFRREGRWIRDAFDTFFDFFEKLYAFRKNGLLKLEDYVYFHYWFEIMRDIERLKADTPGIKKAIDGYIDEYHFRGARELLQEYDRSEYAKQLEIMNDREAPN